MSAKPKRIEVPLPGGGTMAFRHLTPVGPFRMGSRGFYADEEPVHEVLLAEDFWLTETPVTQRQFAVWTDAEDVSHENHFKDHPDQPAENMDWQEANRYCAWLTAVVVRAALPPGFGQFCLPTEAEWEYACRAGSETEYYNGDGEAALAQVGWYDGNSENASHPVASRGEQHPFGFHDMHGNVWEWCHDAFEEGAYRIREDGSADSGWRVRQQDWAKGMKAMLASNHLRVVRGGSWYDSAGNCRSASRDRIGSDARDKFYGFRVCLVRGPSVQTSSRGGSSGTRRQGARDGPGVGRASPGRSGSAKEGLEA